MNKWIKFILAAVIMMGVAHAGPKKNVPEKEEVITALKKAGKKHYNEGMKVHEIGTMKTGPSYMHIFSTYNKEEQKYHTILFNNNKKYLGFYPTLEEIQSFNEGELVYPYGDPVVITIQGPPPMIDLDEETAKFVPAIEKKKTKAKGHDKDKDKDKDKGKTKENDKDKK